MKIPLPSIYELSQLAIALHGAKAAKGSRESFDALRGALSVWYDAAVVLGEQALTQAETEERIRAENANPDDALLLMGDENGSPVLNWINTNYPKDRKPNEPDVFKTFKNFKAAWLKVFPDERAFYFSHRVYEIRRFMDGRIDQKRANDAERKRRAREKQAEKPSKKIAVGQDAVPSGQPAKKRERKRDTAKKPLDKAGG